MGSLHNTGFWLVLLASAALAGTLRGNPDDATERIAGLIKQLGDERFAQREAANKALESLGEKALPALRSAAADGADLEIRQRSHKLVRSIILAARTSKSTGLEMALIDLGEFQMGSDKEANRRADEAQHRVRIARSFLLGACEVTQDEYQKIMKTNPSWFAAGGGGKAKVKGTDTGRFPVDTVCWYDAIEFCNRLSKQDGYEPYYKVDDVKREAGSIKSARVTIAGGSGYRLPTEAEWEYACRAGKSTRFHFGHGNTGREANVRPGPSTGYGLAPNWQPHERTTKVGIYPPNAWGLFDMHGNASEWCWDWYEKDYYANAPANDPHGPDNGQHRVSRGGSWLVSEINCRSAARQFHVPEDKNYFHGFRVARAP